MIQIDDLFEMGVNFQNQNNIPMAIQVYNEVLKADQRYGMVHINMAKILNQQGNFQGEREALVHFSRCPLNMVTLDLVNGVKQRLGELDKQLGSPILPTVTK